jgi:hypothetical protein
MAAEANLRLDEDYERFRQDAALRWWVGPLPNRLVRLRGSHIMTLVDPGVIGERDARTQGGAIVSLSGRPRTWQRAAERGRATQSLIV